MDFLKQFNQRFHQEKSEKDILDILEKQEAVLLKILLTAEETDELVVMTDSGYIYKTNQHIFNFKQPDLVIDATLIEQTKDYLGYAFANDWRQNKLFLLELATLQLFNITK